VRAILKLKPHWTSFLAETASENRAESRNNFARRRFIPRALKFVRCRSAVAFAGSLRDWGAPRVPGDEMRNLVVAITACVAFAWAMAPVGAMTMNRDRAWWSSGDPALRLFSHGALRVAHRGGRISVTAPLRPTLFVGIAF
jgi:hypothetical protein